MKTKVDKDYTSISQATVTGFQGGSFVNDETQLKVRFYCDMEMNIRTETLAE